MSGYLAEKVNDLNSGYVSEREGKRFRMGRCASPAALSANLGAAIIGQSAAIDAVVRALTLSAAGIRDPHRPIASLLFAGPTGVGKTELARRLAAEIAGDADRLCRIDMASLAQEHYAASLSGAPPGYAGSKEQFTLFDRELVEGNSSRPGIVLFDEVEKAHPVVLRALLQILDTGVLRLTAGNSTISFRNSVILLTSNLGSVELVQQLRRSAAQRLAARVRARFTDSGSSRDAVLAVVEEFFEPELFNRFDEIIVFEHLGRDRMGAILDVELRAFSGLLAKRRVTWTPSDAVREHLLDFGFDRAYGARHLKRVLRIQLYAPVAEAIVAAGSEPVRVLTAVRDRAIVASVRADAESLRDA